MKFSNGDSKSGKRLVVATAILCALSLIILIATTVKSDHSTSNMNKARAALLQEARGALETKDPEVLKEAIETIKIYGVKSEQLIQVENNGIDQSPHLPAEDAIKRSINVKHLDEKP
jgi:hypothetical protein